MRPSLPSLLLLAAAEEIQHQGGDLDAPTHVEIRNRDLHLVVDKLVTEEHLRLWKHDNGTAAAVTKVNGQAAPQLGHRRGLEFSPTEEAIMASMAQAAGGWLTKPEIAAACKMSASSQFCAILTNLVERQYLKSGHRGYRLSQSS